jgi:hypothetical protein
MDHEVFDRLTRVLGTLGSRRGTLGALLGAGLAGSTGVAEAAKKGKSKNRKKDRQKHRAQAPAVAAPAVEAEAVVCEPPRHSANLSGCNYNNRDLSGADLSSSRMVGTSFRGTNLCGADLSSSQLKNADFRGTAANVTNLTGADLHSSGCSGILTNNRTIFCNTIGCDGDIINPDCDGCCSTADCTGGEICNIETGQCEPPPCLTNGLDCDTASQCCQTQPTTCAHSGTNIGELFGHTRCCNAFGQTCSSPLGCCAVNVSPGTWLVNCSPNGICGGPGAGCSGGPACASGRCVGFVCQ